MVMRHRSRVRKKPLAEINVVPYIDVMLVLLVIFMITAPLLMQGVSVQLPQAAAKALPPKDSMPIVVSVDRQGNYFLNIAAHPDQAIPPQSLVNQVAATLQLAKKRNQERDLYVKGDRDVDYGKVVQAMVLLQHAGAKSVGLMTKDPNKQ